MENNNDNLLMLPVLPLRGLVVFPKSLIHFDVGRSKSINAITRAMKNDQLVFLVAQKDPSENDPDLTNVYSMGVVAKIIQVLKQPDNSTRIVIEGKYRAKIQTPVFDKHCLMAEVEPKPVSKQRNTSRELALMRTVKEEFEEYVNISPKMPTDIIFKVASCKSSGELADYITSNIILDYQVKQMILEELNETDRLEMLLDILTNEVYILNIEKEIVQKAKNRIDENQRD